MRDINLAEENASDMKIFQKTINIPFNLLSCRKISIFHKGISGFSA